MFPVRRLARLVPSPPDAPDSGGDAIPDAPGLNAQPRSGPAPPVIGMVGVTKTYPGAAASAVADLSFAVAEGEVVALLGPSGCGKTTTLRLIAGFESPDEGEISVGGGIVAAADQWMPPERRGLGMIFQQFALFPHLTVLQNAMYGLKGVSPAERRRVAEAELERVGMAEYLDRYPHQLSGGQQQRVALARALAPQPVVLLMDEPFGSLDAALRTTMRREVKTILAQRGATAVIVTHDQEEAFTLADRVLILRRGRLEQLNTPDNIYHKPASRFVAAFVGQADFVPVTLSDGYLHSELGAFPLKRGAAGKRPSTSSSGPTTSSSRSTARGQGVVDAVVVEREFKGADNVYNRRVALRRSGAQRAAFHAHLQCRRASTHLGPFPTTSCSFRAAEAERRVAGLIA